MEALRPATKRDHRLGLVTGERTVRLVLHVLPGGDITVDLDELPADASAPGEPGAIAVSGVHDSTTSQHRRRFCRTRPGR